MLHLTHKIVAQAQQVQEQLHNHTSQHCDRLVQRLTQTLESFVPRVEQVITQTTRRVMQGETVSAGEKLVSLFEPHTVESTKKSGVRPQNQRPDLFWGLFGSPTSEILWLDKCIPFLSEQRVSPNEIATGSSVIPPTF